MDKYLENSKRFNWGNTDEPLNIGKKELLNRYSSGKTLDVGCASGRYTNYLSSIGRQVEGVDTQPKLIQRAKKTFPKIKFQVGSAYKLPYSSSSFETVVLFDILEHLDDVLVLKEAIRVGKKVIISVPRTNQIELTKFSISHHHYLDRTHVRDYTAKSLTNVLKSVGLHVVICEESLPVSVTALAANHLSKGSKLKANVIRLLLRLFGKEKPLYSTVFAVAEKIK